MFLMLDQILNRLIKPKSKDNFVGGYNHLKLGGSAGHGENLVNIRFHSLVCFAMRSLLCCCYILVFTYFLGVKCNAFNFVYLRSNYGKHDFHRCV